MRKERELEGCSGEGELGLMRGPEWAHVALSFCVFDIHSEYKSGNSGFNRITLSWNYWMMHMMS